MKRFTPAAVRTILVSRKPSAELAERYHCSASAINCIRRGKYYETVLPELPRWGSQLCGDCIHCRDDQSCGLGIPEAAVIGPVFARECSTYQRREG